MKKRSILSLIIVLTMLFVSACSSNGGQAPSSNNSKENVFPDPKKTVKLIVPYAAGGGTDLSARALQPYLEKELGTTVVIENITGGGGWVGWSTLAQSQPDGYTLAYMNFPNVIVGYMNPTAGIKQNLESFDFIANHVMDAGVMAILPGNENYSNVEELIEYAKNNEITITTSGVGSANHFLGAQMNKELGTKFKFVPYGGAGEFIPAVLGGHVDVYLSGLAEVMEFLKSGELEPLAVFGNERSEDFPDVPTVNEVTGIKTEKFLSRGIAAPTGLDEAVLQKLQNALVAAESNPEHIEKIKALGMEVNPIKGEEYKTYMKNLEASLESVKGIFGW